MKTVLNTQPVFTPAAKTLDFSNTPNFDLKRLIAVINVTNNVVIYAVGTPNGYTSFLSNVLTLSYDTTSQNSADVLTCLYDYSTNEVTSTTIESLITELKSMNEVMQYMIMSINSMTPQMDTQKRPFVRVDSISANLTLTTLTNLTNMSNLTGGNTAQLPWQLGVGATHIYDKIIIS